MQSMLAESGPAASAARGFLQPVPAESGPAASATPVLIASMWAFLADFLLNIRQLRFGLWFRDWSGLRGKRRGGRLRFFCQLLRELLLAQDTYPSRIPALGSRWLQAALFQHTYESRGEGILRVLAGLLGIVPQQDTQLSAFRSHGEGGALLSAPRLEAGSGPGIHRGQNDQGVREDNRRHEATREHWDRALASRSTYALLLAQTARSPFQTRKGWETPSALLGHHVSLLFVRQSGCREISVPTVVSRCP